ncbi:hypothetical protein [Paraburkholderia sp. BL21I4N1]|uniref:hypothetical protein n=1 Tax=Paraburkholderia sp. BL21I4N1 TaxID=1938801 RepID=UPI000D4DE692|nr:hypothetical protein [Paraburkholderia sp. BL21I4N1]PQV51812.1 hypothetical protein B0G83_10419 [Paraburkholderia sp. BL21I4N1]
MSPQAEGASTPNAHDGEMAAVDALLIVSALRWLHNNFDVSADREDIDGDQPLVELGLNALGKQIETTQRALSICRSEQAAA